jgi:hypothetical protein
VFYPCFALRWVGGAHTKGIVFTQVWSESNGGGGGGGGFRAACGVARGDLHTRGVTDTVSVTHGG